LYHADLPEQNDVAIREALDTFKSNYKLLADESKRNVEGIRTGLTRLRKYSRDGGERGETSYEQAISSLHPKDETRKRLEGNPEAAQLGTYASRILNRGQQLLINIVRPQKTILSDEATTKKLTSVGQLFDKMPMVNNAPIVRDAYNSLVKILDAQYKKLPIKVIPHSVPIRLPDGTIKWINSTEEPYKNSDAVRNDIENNNQMKFYTTNPETFGSGGTDYSGHPLLEKSPFKSASVQVHEAEPVIGEDGKPTGEYKAGKAIPGKTAQYDLLYNDALRVVHDYYAHATSGAQFGARGEEKAWAAHVATILKEPGISDADKLKGIWALTTETRGQNTWVNFVHEGNKVINADLDKARQLEKDGKVDEANSIREKYKYPNGIQFSDQKVGLLPQEALIRGYGEETENDKQITKLIQENPDVVKQIDEAISNQGEPPAKEVLSPENEDQRESNVGKPLQITPLARDKVLLTGDTHPLLFRVISKIGFFKIESKSQRSTSIYAGHRGYFKDRVF
jgi:hypothetical protein